jgi:riboflavin kinase / FMN adenylyltransferase
LLARLSGEVKHYAGHGREFGYPTANIAAETDLADGVYFGRADLGDYRQNPALVFIGTPTTVGDTVRRVEAHLLDIPDRDHYGERLDLDVLRYWRANITFGSVKELLAAMKNDETAGRAWFEQAPLEFQGN